MSDVAGANSETISRSLATRAGEKARLAWRMSAITVVTLALWGCLNIDSLVRRGRDPFAIVNSWASRWAALCFWIFGVRLHADGPYIGQRQLYPGQGNNGVGRIFVLNHHSMIDIPIAYRLLSAHAISRHDLANWPIIGRVSKRLGTFFVDRSSRRSGADVLQEVDATLADGEGVVMFPEGTSYRGDQVRAFRPGAFKAAERAGAEMVPLGVAYEDDDACYYHEPFTTHMKRIAKRRRQLVAVVAGNPIPFEGRTPVEMKDFLHERVQELALAARAKLDNKT